MNDHLFSSLHMVIFQERERWVVGGSFHLFTFQEFSLFAVVKSILSHLALYCGEQSKEQFKVQSFWIKALAK